MDGTPGTVSKFAERAGGFLNYQHEGANALDEEAAKIMLKDANEFLTKHFPWMQDFVVFQLGDNTIRLDVADRAFLFDD